MQKLPQYIGAAFLLTSAGLTAFSKVSAYFEADAKQIFVLVESNCQSMPFIRFSNIFLTSLTDATLFSLVVSVGSIYITAFGAQAG